ncbi:ABC transporter permease [Nocardiopsis sp. FIRDI 009]|uniref:ABC transporter permease n=1 Tax=Nocardiopsis sp. FIRDI 009 TaxID=714197 RepID=UPI000E22CF40|nr:ABC transporter permease [Nocardiopsis sp. FIRDI 009]
MPNVIAAEARKLAGTRTWLYVALGGVALGLSASYGFAAEVEDASALTPEATATVTESVIRAWMMMHLFASILGAVMVTREYNSGTVSRSVLLSGGRDRLFAAKTVVGTGAGVLLGAATAGVALASPYVFMPMNGMDPEMTTTAYQTALGVFAVTALAAPFGVFLGWLIRNQVATVLVLALVTVGLEPYLLRAVPEVAKYLMSIAMSSVYLDGKPELLSVPAALAVIGGWLAVTGLAGNRLLTSRDVA